MQLITKHIMIFDSFVLDITHLFDLQKLVKATIFLQRILNPFHYRKNLLLF